MAEGAAVAKVTVEVEGRRLALSNLGKPLYPDGTTKGQVIDYYTRVAPVLLPHLAGRPLTLKRYPNGTAAGYFYEKNAPRGRPDWVRTVRLPAPRSTRSREMIDYVVCGDLPTLVWVANLASVELHTPQFRVDGAGAALPSDQLVIDLDPGDPAALPECCAVALLLRALLGELRPGAPLLAKTSGSKGLQLLAPWDPGDGSAGSSSDFARGLAERLERERPALVVSRMTKALRPGKVLIDWSQNSRAKTTVSAYSLRARERPTVSAPVGWDEVAACAAGAPLSLLADDVLARTAAAGDPLAALLP